MGKPVFFCLPLLTWDFEQVRVWLWFPATQGISCSLFEPRTQSADLGYMQTEGEVEGFTISNVALLYVVVLLGA